MTTERQKTAVEKFISLYFSNLGKFILVNLIFALPLALSVGICYFLCKFLLPYPTVVLPFALCLAAPFYPGVVAVSKNIYFDELTSSIFSDFLKAVRENFKSFILHGIVAYVAFVGCYHGIVIYKTLSSASPVFYVMFFVSILLALLLLFFLYGLPMMSVFFDLKLKDVYKNSALMTFGELKANFFATFGIIAYVLVLSLPIMLMMLLSYIWGEAVTAYVVFAYVILSAVLLLPSGVCSIIIACIYPDMKRVISGEAMKNIEEIRAENEVGLNEKKKAAELSDIDMEALDKSSGDYVFYNGKMIKKSVIMEELKEREEK